MRLVAPLHRPRPSHRLVFWAMASASLLVAHDAVFLVQLGPGEPLARALRGGGHAYWEAASILLLAGALIAALGVALRLATLHRHVRSLGGPGLADHDRPGRRALALRLWARLLAVVGIGFTLQENVEHLAGHEHFLGLAALHGPEYPLALPVLTLVTGLAAVVGAVLLGVERELLAAITAGHGHGARAPRSVLRAPLQLRLVRRSPLARRGAGRAPPTRLVSASIG